MPWEELLDITPGMFIALERERAKSSKERADGWRFLATVISKTVSGLVGGQGVNFMEDGADGRVVTLDEAEPFFKSWSEIRNRGEQRDSDQGA